MIQGGFKELLDEFLLEARERVDEVESQILELASGDEESRPSSLARAKRELHTLKGNSGMMGFSDLQHLAHRMEDQVEALDLGQPRVDEILLGVDALRHGLEQVSSEASEDGLSRTGLSRGERSDESPATAASAGVPASGGPPAVGSENDQPAQPETEAPRHRLQEAGISSVRVPFSKIDQLVEIQAESLIFRNRLSDCVRRSKVLAKHAEKEVEGITAAWEEIEAAQQSLEKILGLLQQQVTELGMVPLQGLFRSLRRIVHDESSREGKRVELEVRGGETPLDKALLEAAREAMGHLVRNAIIHGIERPSERQRRGKKETGRLRLSATVDVNEVQIELADDGAGIDIEALRARSVKRSQTAEIGSDFALLFEEGLSTKDDADLSAGRGVGLAAVKKSVERHGGRVAVQSRRHRGTTFLLRLPLSASILRSLTLRTDGEDYALPLTAVAETLRPRAEDRHEINHAGVVRWRRRLVPILDLGYAFGTAQAPRAGGVFVLIEVNGRYRALAVDEVVGIRDIVVKGLDNIVGDPVGISGSTVLGDGRVIMILDPAALATIPPFTGSER